MAVCRCGIPFWVGYVRSQGCIQPLKQQRWILAQAVDWQWLSLGQTRPLSSVTWALVPPNSLRYQGVKQPALSHPFQRARQLQKATFFEEDWEESLSVRVLVRPGEFDGQHTLVEIPLFGQTKLGELLAPGANKPMEFLFPLTTVDGSTEDDVSVGMKVNRSHGNASDIVAREHGSFRSLFEAEGCPSPFMNGSSFYCFHCPGKAPNPPGCGTTSQHIIGLENQSTDLSLLLSTSLCSHAGRAEGGHNEKESEGEEKLALLYEKLRIELPNFFLKSHDYSMYSSNVQFVNGLNNTKTRGRVTYQLMLSVWRLLCLCYYAEARLEVLKLTKHMEDGTVKARWRIKGLPVHTLLLRFYRKDKSHLYRTYDALSTFYIGHDGLIHCHKVEKVMQVQPPVLPRVTTLLTGVLVALGVQEHRPAPNVLPLILSSLRQGRN